MDISPGCLTTTGADLPDVGSWAARICRLSYQHCAGRAFLGAGSGVYASDVCKQPGSQVDLLRPMMEPLIYVEPSCRDR